MLQARRTDARREKERQEREAPTSGEETRDRNEHKALTAYYEAIIRPLNNCEYYKFDVVS